MFKSVKPTLKAVALTSVVTGTVSFSALVHAELAGIGRTVTAEEIAGWDIDVRPDGMGLPVGEGSVLDGEALYEAKCAACHGLFGEGEGRWPVLAGGKGTLAQERPTKTVGSYWPYASTLYDYIYRAMPFTAPRSLSAEETYAISAYVLYLNDLVDEEFVLSNENLASIEMPNKDGFFVDPRPDVNNPLCMENCADASTMKIQGSIGGVTPISHFVEGADGPAASHEAQHELESEMEKERLKELGVEVEESASASKPAELSATALAGKAVYEQACAACHGMGIAGAPKVGDKAAWTARNAQGMETLVSHAINGYQGNDGVMPAKGGRTDLSDEAVSNAVAFMAESSR